MVWNYANRACSIIIRRGESNELCPKMGIETINIESMASVTLVDIKVSNVIIVDFFPKILIMVAIDVVFVAGPTIKNTMAAPIVAPFIIIANAMGIDAVAQTYKGSPIIIINIIEKNPVPI